MFDAPIYTANPTQEHNRTGDYMIIISILLQIGLIQIGGLPALLIKGCYRIYILQKVNLYNC
jgi:hypothetical protein